jgi:hypothetical protein
VKKEKTMATKTSVLGRPASEWELLFRTAGVALEKLEVSKSRKARSTTLGQFLGQYVDREVPIQAKGKSGRATLRVRPWRSNQKRYFFEIIWDEPEDQGSQPQGEAAAANHGADDAIRTPLRPESSCSGLTGKFPTKKIIIRGKKRRCPKTQGNGESW